MTILELVHALLHKAAQHPDGVVAGAAQPVYLATTPAALDTRDLSHIGGLFEDRGTSFTYGPLGPKDVERLYVRAAGLVLHPGVEAGTRTEVR